MDFKNAFLLFGFLSSHLRGIMFLLAPPRRAVDVRPDSKVSKGPPCQVCLFRFQSASATRLGVMHAPVVPSLLGVAIPFRRTRNGPPAAALLGERVAVARTKRGSRCVPPRPVHQRRHRPSGWTRAHGASSHTLVHCFSGLSYRPPTCPCVKLLSNPWGCIVVSRSR